MKSQQFKFKVRAFAICAVALASFTAAAQSEQYSLSVNNVGGQSAGIYGTVAITTGSTTGNIPGTSVMVTAMPKTGYSFWKWVASRDVATAAVSTDAAYTFNITANIDKIMETANFHICQF